MTYNKHIYNKTMVPDEKSRFKLSRSAAEAVLKFLRTSELT